jgi:hypothetical protein
MFEVKLVPTSDPQAEGRWTNVAADQMWNGRRVGAEFVVKFSATQPFYQHGGYPTPEITLARETKTDG